MIKLSARTLIILTILITIISFYSIIGFISSISSETFKLSMYKNESTGGWTFALNANPINRGFLDIGLYIELTIFDSNNQVIAKGSKYVLLKAGRSETFSVNLNVPAEFVPDGVLENANGIFQMELRVRILWDLVGVTQVMKIRGGQA